MINKTILMIHGMSGGNWIWKNYKNYFEEKNYHCITPILRYHDMDPKENPDIRLGTTGILDYVIDIEKQIAYLEMPPIIMGHSMGGLIAQILASRGLASSLILLTPAAPYGIMSLSLSVIKSFRSALTRWGFWRNPFKQTFDEAVYSMLQLLAPEEQREIYKKLVYESGRAICQIGFWFLDCKKSTSVDSKISCPVLVIAGTKDRITPASAVKKVAYKYKADYKEFPNHAHWVTGELDWQEIAQYVHNWLTVIDPALYGWMGSLEEVN